MANQVGVTGHASLLAAQILHLRDTKPEIWAKTTRVSVASGFLCSILSGKIVGFYEAEAAATGLYSLPKEQWEDKVLQIVAGSDGTGKLKASLGGVERNAAIPVGRVSTYFTTKYGLDGGECMCGASIKCLSLIQMLLFIHSLPSIWRPISHWLRALLIVLLNLGQRISSLRRRSRSLPHLTL
jgi:ribulose kinase